MHGETVKLLKCRCVYVRCIYILNIVHVLFIY